MIFSLSHFPHFPHFPPLTSHLSPLTSHLSPLTSHYSIIAYANHNYCLRKKQFIWHGNYWQMYWNFQRTDCMSPILVEQIVCQLIQRQRKFGLVLGMTYLFWLHVLFAFWKYVAIIRGWVDLTCRLHIAISFTLWVQS